VHNYNKTHLQKQNQTNNTQHRICEIHVLKFFFFWYGLRSTLGTENIYTKTKSNKHKQNIEYMKYMYMYQDIFLQANRTNRAQTY